MGMKFFKKPGRWFLIAMLIYIVTYVANSSRGGYWPKADFGQYSYNFGLGIPTQHKWQPYFGYHDSQQTSLLGWIYLPLIAVDQKWCHPALDDFDDEDRIWSRRGPAIRWHPRFKPEPPSLQSQRRTQLKRIGTALKNFRNDHSNSLPAKLSDLVPRYIDSNAFTGPTSALAQASSHLLGLETNSTLLDVHGAYAYLGPLATNDILVFERPGIWRDKDTYMEGRIFVLSPDFKISPLANEKLEAQTRPNGLKLEH
jgi:hypothetical protein